MMTREELDRELEEFLAMTKEDKIEAGKELLEEVDNDIIIDIKARCAVIYGLRLLTSFDSSNNNESTIKKAKEELRNSEMVDAIWPIIFKYTEPDD